MLEEINKKKDSISNGVFSVKSKFYSMSKIILLRINLL